MNNSKFGIIFTLAIIALTTISFMNPAFAGAPAVNPPDFESKFVSDDGSELDVTINAISPIPITPPGFIGYGTIIGTDGGGNPVLRVATSHAGVCDSETQVFGVCSGIWHNHDAVLRTPVDLASDIDIDGDQQTEAISDCSDQGATFEVDALSFQSPGTVSVLGSQISMKDLPKTSVSNNNVITNPFTDPYDYSQNPLIQKNIYPIVKFRIFVATADGSPALDPVTLVPLPIDGERRVCIFDVMAMDSMVIGGELLSTDTTALLVAGTLFNGYWIIPIVAGAAAVGIVLARRK